MSAPRCRSHVEIQRWPAGLSIQDPSVSTAKQAGKKQPGGAGIGAKGERTLQRAPWQGRRREGGGQPEYRESECLEAQ
eukprot:15782178-Heterocapsa_arctica.AAC.1